MRIHFSGPSILNNGQSDLFNVKESLSIYLQESNCSSHKNKPKQEGLHLYQKRKTSDGILILKSSHATCHDCVSDLCLVGYVLVDVEDFQHPSIENEMVSRSPETGYYTQLRFNKLLVNGKQFFGAS